MIKTKKYNKAYLLVSIVIFLLIILSLSTKFYGHIDIGDYGDVAKQFAGSYQAKMRTSHSVVYSLLHAPLVKLTNSFLFFKLSSVLWLSLLTISVYYISNKNFKALLLFVTTPILWYMAPWVNPIQIASLLFLWGYYFIKKYHDNKKIINLFYSGILIAFAWTFWEAVLYFTVILAICFLYDKPAIHFLYFALALFIGLIPKLIIDQVLFGFAFYSIIKHFFAVFSSIAYGGIYNTQGSRNLWDIIYILFFIPFFSYLFYTKKIFSKSENKRTFIFLLLSLIIIFVSASQIRYTLMIVPIIILLLAQTLNEKQFKIQLAIFLIISLIVINPYLIQINYNTNAQEFGTLFSNLGNITITKESMAGILLEDLEEIQEDYPGQVFVVGNLPDDYQKLAHIYWGGGIQEFISIQDYRLYMDGESVIAGKTLCSSSKTWNRRDICITIDLTKTLDDQTDYDSIIYGISLEKDLDINGFELAKEYKLLSVFEK